MAQTVQSNAKTDRAINALPMNSRCTGTGNSFRLNREIGRRNRELREIEAAIAEPRPHRPFIQAHLPTKFLNRRGERDHGMLRFGQI
jgi:hypothetical protein